VTELLKGGYDVTTFGNPPKDAPNCPDCVTARLAIRVGPYGRFWGCENFPLCEFKDETCPPLRCRPYAARCRHDAGPLLRVRTGRTRLPGVWDRPNRGACGAVGAVLRVLVVSAERVQGARRRQVSLTPGASCPAFRASGPRCRQRRRLVDHLVSRSADATAVGALNSTPIPEPGPASW
jgi:ssDNA-binding Zn-finger/Zn-ribbon topoisomerase 1